MSAYTCTTSLRYDAAANAKRHFAFGANFYKLFWVFTFGSLFGFFVETLWCLAKNGELLIRSSMIIGPFNFVYGAGAVIFYLTVRIINRQHPIHIMFVGMTAGTIIEHGSSLFQEAAFGTVSWDYSAMPFNIGGRVCLLYTLFWGILALVWARALQLPLEKLIARIPDRWGRQLTWAMLAFFVVFSIISAAAVSRWTGRADGIPAASSFGVMLDSYFPDSFMETIYNNMIFLP